MSAARRIRALPGTSTSCVLLTVLTIMVAVFSDRPEIDAFLRPLYFAALCGFFLSLGTREPGLRGSPLRLIQLGFFVLTIGFTAGALLRHRWDPSDPIPAAFVVACERGGVFLLGLTLVSFGIVLWIPELLRSRDVLLSESTGLRGELALSEEARRRMEQRLVDAARLQSVGELAAGVAHDLRNPLAIIKATIESLHRRPRTPEETEEHSQVIVRNIEKAERTISGLLELGKPRLETPQVFELADTVAETLALVAIESRRARIPIHWQHRAGIQVLGDRRLLVQALLNLALNALQAMSAGGNLEVTVRSFRIGPMDCGAVILADDGSGIAEEVRSHLFNPFFTTKPEGTGLGLLSTRRIADELGGRVGLFPRNRGGARAVFLLPLAPAEVLR